MKYFLFSSLSLILFFTLSQCTKDDKPNYITEMTATVNGKAWRGDSTGCTIQNGQIILIGRSDSGEQVTFLLDGETPKIYNCDNQSASKCSFQTQINTPAYSTKGSQTDKGTVSITEINQVEYVLSGTFTFTGTQDNNTEKITVSNGVFKNVPWRR